MKADLPDAKLGVYRHYKGSNYELIGVAHHSETLEKMVVYKALYATEQFGDNAFWVRPYEMFFEKVKEGGKEVPRFEFIGEKCHESS